MSLGQIRMCDWSAAALCFSPTVGGSGPALVGRLCRPVIRNLMPRCAPSAVTGERNGHTLARSVPDRVSFIHVADADSVQHRSHSPPLASSHSASVSVLLAPSLTNLDFISDYNGPGSSFGGAILNGR